MQDDGHLEKKDLETLRKMPSPPPPVQRCLECIYIALHVEKFKAKAVSRQPGKRLHVEWADVQRMLANFQTFYPMMENFDVEARHSLDKLPVSSSRARSRP